MDSAKQSSRPARVQVIGALALIAVLVAVVGGIFWAQAADEQYARDECATTLLEGQTVEECMLVQGY